jgi:hypothetical protein
MKQNKVMERLNLDLNNIKHKYINQIEALVKVNKTRNQFKDVPSIRQEIEYL